MHSFTSAAKIQEEFAAKHFLVGLLLKVVDECCSSSDSNVVMMVCLFPFRLGDLAVAVDYVIRK